MVSPLCFEVSTEQLLYFSWMHFSADYMYWPHWGHLSSMHWIFLLFMYRIYFTLSFQVTSIHSDSELHTQLYPTSLYIISIFSLQLVSAVMSFTKPIQQSTLKITSSAANSLKFWVAFISLNSFKQHSEQSLLTLASILHLNPHQLTVHSEEVPYHMLTSIKLDCFK